MVTRAVAIVMDEHIQFRKEEIDDAVDFYYFVIPRS